MGRPDGAEAHLDGDLGAVLAKAEELEAGPHGPRRRTGEEPTYVAGVGATKAGRNQLLQLTTEELRARTAKQSFGLQVREYDLPFRVDADHRVGRGVEKLPILLAGALVGVANRRHRGSSWQTWLPTPCRLSRSGPRRPPPQACKR